MSATAPVKRKFPPPCWTRDEALVLIEAYRERWYALHRAFLKNPDWDAVAEKVTTACPEVTPPKTPAQCRHKMEKLRQRYRAEKLRAESFPGGRFFSSWFYFEAMEAMERGLEAAPEKGDPVDSDIRNGIPILDHQSLNPGRGVRFKPSVVNNWCSQEEVKEDVYLLDYNIHKQQSRKVSKVVHDHDHDHEIDENREMWVKVGRKGNNWKAGLNKGKKRGIHEVVASIKVLGDGFMRMEKMKMDMCREIERMRMETEMKRNELILESQKQIVDAFLKGMVEARQQPRTE